MCISDLSPQPEKKNLQKYRQNKSKTTSQTAQLLQSGTLNRFKEVN